ncbi:potassium/proton antiporter [Rhodospirillaceae bacterium SYSU D60014]|uniref:potassium/proton antiporter n=1 Tax=Virgifigura deserti TaxID=2268457 RepID=UPI000E660B61
MAGIGFINSLILLGAVLTLAGMLSSVVAFRIGAPVLIAVLAVGMLAGREGLGLAVTDHRLTFLVGSLALVVILFDGGLRTRLATFRLALWPSVLLATAGVMATAGIVGFIAAAVLGLSILEGLLLGATVASTDAAAVFFLLRGHGLRVARRVEAVLEIESATNDPIAVFLTLALIELLLAAQPVGPETFLLDLLLQAVLGTAVGVAGGFVTSWALNRLRLPNGLLPPFALVSAVALYGTAAVLGGSGFLAVYLAGLVVGNRPMPAGTRIIIFHEAMAWFAQVAMFLVLGLLVTPSHLIGQFVPALAVAGSLMLLARPVAVWLCLAPFGFHWREWAFTSAMGLRGAIGIFLASLPILAGAPRGEAYFNVAFFVVLISLLLQGWTATPIARWLGLVRPAAAEPRRVDLDPPIDLPEEMVGYPVVEGAPILEGQTLPDGARFALVLRGDRILLPAEAGALAAGDYVYVLVSTANLTTLDHLFSMSAPSDVAVPEVRPRAGLRHLDATGLSVQSSAQSHDAEVS